MDQTGIRVLQCTSMHMHIYLPPNKIQTTIFTLMASMPFTRSLTVFFIALLIIISHYLSKVQDEFQNGAIYAQPVRVNPSWFEVVAREIGGEIINVGLVNMDENEMTMVDEVRTKGRIFKVDFAVADKGLQWSDFFPVGIDENSPAKCPELPMPEFGNYEELDVVVARAPCEESRLRDVFRLQVNLVVANLLVRNGRRMGNGVDSNRPVFAVFVGSCGPMWEIFRCDDLLAHVGDSWIYKPQLWRIKQKILMPVGTCQISPPFPQSGEEDQQPREAYATVLHSSEAYVCGAIALAQSIIQSNSTKDLILLADDHLSSKSLTGLRSAGWRIKRMQRIRSPNSKKNAYNEWNYSKLRLWELEEYDKIMFIDSDLIVTRNLDNFFTYPQISAAANDGYIFNSGLMLIEPSKCTFKTLMKMRWWVKSYNGGDQGFLNEMFPWWHRLPSKANRLKFFHSAGNPKHQVANDTYALHYLGMKPWACYRDYDCNWDRPETQKFASDSANERWWRVYDNMPEKLRGYCSLSPQMDARIRKYRNRARDGKFPDGHWRIQVKDPRQYRL